MVFFSFSSHRDRKFNTCPTCPISKTRFIASIFPSLSWINCGKSIFVTFKNFIYRAMGIYCFSALFNPKPMRKVCANDNLNIF